EFIKRLENNYCTDLNRYRFDKSQCAQCPFNTNCYSLFPDEKKNGKCLNMNCLTERNRQFLVESCKNIIIEHPDIDICKSTYNSGYEEVYADLSEQGFTVDETSIRSFPDTPKTPVREEFEDDTEYETAKDEYYTEMADFHSNMDNIEQMFSEGKAKRIVTFRDNAPAIGYVYLTANSETTGKAEETAIPVEKLEKQDRRNKEIAVENIVDDTRKYIRETDIPQSDFTEFEDKLLYFVMLEDLKNEHFTLFLENPPNKWHLTEDDRIAIINNLTEEQKTLIRRDFLVKHLSDAFGVSKKSYLMLEFARLHFPETLAETECRYNEIYTKRHERITERLTTLKNEVQEVA
ncbi:MAG: hypothetical protein EZS26_003100, partial [Candidatus Ordinivivax streblomastigis]